jgi:lysylphosphatidylglycerol synthetase-like protein (DUF2156 family)
MKQITIGFSRASTTFPIFSWLIMAVQKTNYSHVYLKYDDELSRQIMYYQASHTLVNSMSASVFLAQETVVKEFTFNVSDKSFTACLQFAANQSGKPYGVEEIFGLALCTLALSINIKIDNPLKDAGTTWICDQLIAALLNTCENVTLPMPLNDMLPKDVYALVSSLPPTLSVD